MKGFIATFLFFAAFAAASTIQDFEELVKKEREIYPRFIQFPDGEGNLHEVDLEAPIEEEIIEEAGKKGSRNEYWLYTRKNFDEPQYLVIDDKRSFYESNFNLSNPTVFIVHGWKSNGRSQPNPVIRTAYLYRDDVNVITVDWRRVARGNYVTAVSGVPAVGDSLGNFINWLACNFDLKYEKVHLVGFSLGAHVVGTAGRRAWGDIARVTGLDPAGPLWNLNSNKLSANDGRYVEAIHTDGGAALGGHGIGSDCAHADFYPNGGITQPGCLTNTCNHNRAWEYFAASVSFDHLVGNHCRTSLQVTLNTCRGESLNMGNGDLNKKTKFLGAYRVNTKRKYPF